MYGKRAVFIDKKYNYILMSKFAQYIPKVYKQNISVNDYRVKD